MLPRGISKRLGMAQVFMAEITGYPVMARKNPHIGSSFESWLDEEGIRENVTAAAIKAVIARQLASELKENSSSK
jgi:hypothetical protein